MEINDLFGLPAHPLLVHLPIVLVPLAALVALLATILQRHRRRLAWIAGVLSALALLSTQFAIGSGEAMQSRVKKTDLVRRHAAMGDTVRLYVLVLFVAVLLLGALPYTSWTSVRAQRRRAAVATVSIIVALAAIGSVVSIVAIGHSGAKAVWNDTPRSNSGESPSPDAGSPSPDASPSSSAVTSPAN